MAELQADLKLAKAGQPKKVKGEDGKGKDKREEPAACAFVSACMPMTPHGTARQTDPPFKFEIKRYVLRM